MVEFDGEGQVLVKKETWTKTFRTGDVAGKRTQFPLIFDVGNNLPQATRTYPVVGCNSLYE